MKLRTMCAAAGAAALCVAATSAQAMVTFVGYQTGLNSGEALVTGFEGGPGIDSVAFGLPGYALSGSAVLFTGSTDGLSAAPATGPATRDPTQYLSVQGGQTATLDTPLLSAISFYVGSLDGFNSFTFHLADGSTQVVTGSTLDALPGTDANGDQTGFTTNGRLTFKFDSAIDSVVFASGTNALEISDIGALSAPVPEASAWALMILGMGGAGGLLRRRRASLRFA